MDDTGLQHPVLPLVRLLGMLFLATPEEEVDAVAAALTEPIDTGGVSYPDPAATLAPFLDLARDYAGLKGAPVAIPEITDEDGKPLDAMAALETWIGQRVVERQLETINSRLCGPCGCDLCCTGPAADQQQEFFDIPLRDHEVALFSGLPLLADEDLAHRTPYDEPTPLVADQPFYRHAPCLARWRTGASLILGRGQACPHLRDRRCTIYAQRPWVCRRPQIFAYLLEEDRDHPGRYRQRDSLLAVLDCPYVREHREAIEEFAAKCGLAAVFRHNKG